MAVLSGGVAVSHSPQLSLEPGDWRPHGDLELPRLAGLGLPPSPRSATDLQGDLSPATLASRYEACQRAMEETRDALLAQQPDVLIVVGDDQRELFLDDVMPAVTVFWGSSLDDRPPGADSYPVTMEPVYHYYHAEQDDTYPTQPALGRHLIERLIADEFDVSQFSEQPAGRSLGHAFTFIYRRLLEGCPRIPLVPVLLNTYYPPNQPTPRRCVALGRALRSAIDSWPADWRVAVVASGGLTHPIIDEELDRRLLAALERHDDGDLARLPVDYLVEGSSEIRNWIVAGAAMHGIPGKVIDYIPAYRSQAGSGCGMGFFAWTRSES